MYLRSVYWLQEMKVGNQVPFSSVKTEIQYNFKNLIIFVFQNLLQLYREFVFPVVNSSWTSTGTERKIDWTGKLGICQSYQVGLSRNIISHV